MRQTIRSSGLGSTLLRVTALGVAILILIAGFRDADIGKALELVRGIGGLLVLVAVPALIALALDSVGWAMILRRLDHAVPFGSLFSIRLGTEAVQLSVLAGAFVSETLRPWLLERRHGVPWSKGLASLAARKRYIVLGNGLYLAIGLAFGASVLERVSVPLIGLPGLSWAAFAAAIGMVGAAWGVGAILGQGAIAGRIHRWLAAVPWTKARAWLAMKEAGFRQTDHELGRSLRGSSVAEIAVTTGLFLAAWLLESVETFVILWLLGVELGFSAILVMEMVLSLVRSIVFVLPAGLGVQDVGYVAFLAALGVPEGTAVGAAFVILKRAKELFWIAVGYVTLFAMGGRPPRTLQVVACAG